MKFETRFCASGDGTRIAYAVREGTAPPLLVVHAWPWVIGGQPGDVWMARVWPERTFVLYDRRGTGASTRDVGDISLERQVEDVAEIVAALGARTIDIFAVWDGTPIAIAFAAEHPDRVGRMALSGPYIRGSDIISRDALRATMDLAHTNWSMLRRSMSTMGGFHGAEVERQMERMRRGLSPEMAARYLELYGTMNVESYVDRVSAPCLIVYQPHDGAVTWLAVQEVASRLPECRLITAGSPSEHWKLLRQFLEREDGIDPSPSPVAPDGTRPERTALYTILFTDIEGSTALTQRLGDAAAQDVLRAHNAVVRDALKTRGGAEIKHTGDGIMASFPSASGAIECAVSIQRTLAAQARSGDAARLRVRIGVNAGEPVAEGEDLFGTAVQLARRVCDAAQPEQILATNVVRELSAGKGFEFIDAGAPQLKGIEHPVHLYEVRWR